MTTTHIEGIPQSDEIKFADHGEFYVRVKIKAECGGETHLLRLTSNGIPFMGEFAVSGTPMKAADGEFGWGVTEASSKVDQMMIVMLDAAKWIKILRPDFYEGRLVEVESVYTPYQLDCGVIVTPEARQ
jgi:hypothetical protein